MNAGLLVRDARPDDLEVIVDFNTRLASETEGRVLDRGGQQVPSQWGRMHVAGRGAQADKKSGRAWVAIMKRRRDLKRMEGVRDPRTETRTHLRRHRI